MAANNKAQIDLILNGKDVENEIKKLETEFDHLKTARKAALEAGDMSSWRKADSEMKKVAKTMRAYEKKVVDVDAVMKNLAGTTKQELSNAFRTLQARLSRMKETDPGYEKMAAQARILDGRIKTLNKSYRSQQTLIQSLSSGFSKYSGILTAFIASIAGVGYSLANIIKGLTGLDDNLANVMKTTGLTRSEVRGLYTDFKQLNTRTKNSVLLEYAEEAGRLGKKGKEDIMGFVEQANKIGTALGDDLGDTKEAINIIGKLVGMYDVGGQFGVDFNDGMNKIGSAINEISANSAAAAPYQIEYLKRLTGTAKQAKLTADQVLGYSSILDQNGQAVEASATAQSKLMIDMFTAPGEYASIAKMEISTFTQLLETDANEAFLMFLEGINGNNEGFTVMAQKFKDLGIDGARAKNTLSMLASNTQNIRKEQLLANKAMAEGTSLSAEYNIKNNNLAGSWEKLMKSFRQKVTNPTLIGFMEDLLFKVVDNRLEGEKLLDSLTANTEQLNKYEESIIPLVDRYDELEKKAILNTEEQAELEKIVTKVVEVIPQAVTEFDAYGRAIRINTGDVRDNVSQQRKLVESLSSKAPTELLNDLQELAKKAAVYEKQATKGTIQTVIRQTYSGRRMMKEYVDLSDSAQRDVQTSLVKTNEKIRKTIDDLVKFAYSGKDGIADLMTEIESFDYERSSLRGIPESQFAVNSDALTDGVKLYRKDIQDVIIQQIGLLNKEVGKIEGPERPKIMKDIIITDDGPGDIDEKLELNDLPSAEDSWLDNERVLLLESYATRRIDKQSYDTGMLMLDLEYWRKKAEQDASSEAESLANRQGYANALSKIMEANQKAVLKPIKASLPDTYFDKEKIKETTDAMEAHMAKHGQFVKQMEVTPTTNVWQSLKANAEDYFNTVNDLSTQGQSVLDTYIETQSSAISEKYRLETEANDEKFAQGLISEERYLQKKTALENKQYEEEKEIQKKTADLQFALTMGQIVAQTALAIMGTWAGYSSMGPFGVGAAIAQTVAIGALATVQTAQAVQQRKIAKGLETGGYTDVTRAQDGKQFTAKNAGNQRGYIDETSILTAENGPEFMMNNDAVNNPTVKPVLDIMNMAQQNGTARTINLPEAMGLTGLEDGGYTNNSSSSSTDSTTPTATQPIVVEARFALFKDSGVSNIDNLTDAITKIIDVSNSLK